MFPGNLFDQYDQRYNGPAVLLKKRGIQITSPSTRPPSFRTYALKRVDNAADDVVASIQAFRLVRNKSFAARNHDRFAGIGRHSRINHEDVRSPHDDFPNNLHRSKELVD